MVALVIVMKITKELKNATFEYDEETKKFLIIDGEDGGVVELNKVYAFAFMRFVVRMAQRNWLRVKKVNKAETLEVEDQEDPNQVNFLESSIYE
ncbi:MAG: hypothetical protein CBC05_08505 [Crocinitomicaceae bacterium TMED45]|nr:MAG: hypothetical protein CBC05_08505 [Crocinitomicaceae bacterium TMED45]|tara:strand:- start:34595 stop:34876 length:282 start_codon:yes stop_codon:yes gene_type:complete